MGWGATARVVEARERERPLPWGALAGVETEGVAWAGAGMAAGEKVAGGAEEMAAGVGVCGKEGSRRAAEFTDGVHVEGWCLLPACAWDGSRQRRVAAIQAIATLVHADVCRMHGTVMVLRIPLGTGRRVRRLGPRGRLGARRRLGAAGRGAHSTRDKLLRQDWAAQQPPCFLVWVSLPIKDKACSTGSLPTKTGATPGTRARGSCPAHVPARHSARACSVGATWYRSIDSNLLLHTLAAWVLAAAWALAAAAWVAAAWAWALAAAWAWGEEEAVCLTSQSACDPAGFCECRRLLRRHRAKPRTAIAGACCLQAAPACLPVCAVLPVCLPEGRQLPGRHRLHSSTRCLQERLPGLVGSPSAAESQNTRQNTLGASSGGSNGQWD